jgi:hypothetical protein
MGDVPRLRSKQTSSFLNFRPLCNSGGGAHNEVLASLAEKGSAGVDASKVTRVVGPPPELQNHAGGNGKTISMKTHPRCTKTVCLLLGLAAAWSLHSQTVTQTIPLTTGWNAIWVEVEPTNSSVNSLFTNLPVESVWPYSDKLASVEFIRDLSEESWNDPGWRRWFPPNSPQAILNTLFTLTAGRSYLVKMTNAATLTIAGRPVLKAIQWVPDAFNLRGFQVAPGSGPTFATFFAASGAHAGQPVYRLNAALGVWTNVVPAVDRLRSGEAYWVYCQGASTYAGPLKVKLDQGDSLAFGNTLQRLNLFLQNLTDSPMSLGINDLGQSGSSPLSLIVWTTNGLAPQPLPAIFKTNIAAGLTQQLQLAIRRTDFPGTNYQSVLEITNNFGSRVLLEVSADKQQADTLGSATPFAGLWVGSASVSNVCEVNSLLNPTNPTPVKSGFDLRLLIHVDTNGVARLLKEVIQMWQNGTMITNADGSTVMDKPGRYVLVTDESLIPQYQGATLRDGVPVGRRISSVGFDFDGGTSNCLAMAGAFATNGALQATVVLEPDFPTNPFRHKYHPDHDNLDADFNPMTPDATGSKEAYRITRQIELQFSAQDPAGTASVESLDYGYQVMGGTYRETVTGLHKNPIVAQGQFRLTRLAVTGVLNQ